MRKHREGDKVKIVESEWKLLTAGYRAGIIETVARAGGMGIIIGSHDDLAIVRFGEVGGTDSYCWLPDTAILNLETTPTA